MTDIVYTQRTINSIAQDEWQTFKLLSDPNGLMGYLARLKLKERRTSRYVAGIEAKFDWNKSTIFVGKQNNIVVGWSIAAYDTLTNQYYAGVFVDSNHRRHGYGQTLFIKALKENLSCWYFVSWILPHYIKKVNNILVRFNNGCCVNEYMIEKELNTEAVI